MRGRILPTLRGAGLFVVGAALIGTGAALDRVELTYFGVVFWGVVLVAALTVALAPSPTRITRSGHHDLIAVGDPLRVVTDLSGGSVAFLENAADAVSPGLVQEQHDDQNSRTAVSWVTPIRRGAHRIGPVRVEMLAPFGVVRAQRSIGPVDEVLAVPSVVPLISVRSRGVDDGDHPARHDRSGHGTDNLVPRPYVAGDSMRRVHWRASAHHGDLMVREEERDQTPEAALVLDLDPASWEDERAFDNAMTACVSVAARLVADGYDVAVTAVDGSPLASVSSRGGLDELLTVCARLEPLGQGSETADLPPGVGLVIGIGSAVPPARAPVPHLLLAASDDHASARGWRTASLDADVAASWAAAIDEVAR